MGILQLFTGKDWGVHPHDDHKRPAADAPLRVMPLPARLCVPLLQHVGAPATPVVAVGERVRRGQLIAGPGGRLSAPVHAPSSGVVTAIGEVTAPHPSGLPFAAITLALDGRDEAIDFPATADPFALSPAEVAQKIADAGIVGLGGATFPSAPKAELGRKLAVQTLIINGGECEPYLSSDDSVMRERAAEVIDGVRILMHATGAANALVGIEDNKPEAIAAMRVAARAIAAGETLSADMLEVRQGALERLPRQLVSDPLSVVGMQATRALDAGSLLQSRSLRAALLVERNTP